MQNRRFVQCDVFTSVPTKGNGLAVVLDGEGLSTDAMQAFAAWTNLAETTFLVTPTVPEADYKLRIFTPAREMLFAGHPTLGSCASWLRMGGKPKNPDLVRQECGIGIVDIDIQGMPAFAAPKTSVAPIAAEKRQAIITALGLAEDRILNTVELTNGPVWQVFELASAADVLAADAARLRFPEFVGIGLLGAHPEGSECQFEVRMLAPSSGMSEDPITGSLNAALAQWKYGAGDWQGAVTVAQGTRIGREGRIFVRRDASTGKVWIGGQTCILIEGTLTL